MLEPITTIGSRFAAKAIGGLIKQKVIERWSQYRADRFIDQLTETLRDELFHDEPETAFDELVDRLLKRDSSSEAIFEAYRRVALSRSRELGPRIIALITATILAEDRVATFVEETMYSAAEALSDAEFLDFLANYKKWSAHPERPVCAPAFQLSYVLETQTSSDDGGELDAGSMMGLLGPWGEKLRSHGIISESIFDKRLPPSSLRDSGHRTVTWRVHMSQEYFGFADLVERVDRAIKRRSVS